MNGNKIFWIIGGTTGLLILLGILSPLALNNPSGIDLYNFEKYVKIAQAFSGYLMPFIAFLAAFLTFCAFYIQFLANQRIQNQFREQQANDHFYKMLDIHIANVQEFEIKSFRKLNEEDQFVVSNSKERSPSFTHAVNTSTIFLNRFFNVNNRPSSELIEEFNHVQISSVNEHDKETIRGRRSFLLMVKDLHLTLNYVHDINKELLNGKIGDEEVLKLSYDIFFWGTDSGQIKTENVDSFDIEYVLLVLDSIRKNFRNNKGAKYTFDYNTREGTKSHTIRFIPFSGHSSRLAHYYRHLYQTLKHIHYNNGKQDEEFLSQGDIDIRFRALRAQMTNEEQLLLYYNYRCGYGHKLDKRYDNEKLGSEKYLFLTKCKMIHNIPLRNMIHYLVQHPEDHFRSFKNKYPKADLFEWGGYN